MHSILSQIIAKKREDVSEQKKRLPVDEVKRRVHARSAVSTFKDKLRELGASRIAIIAEIKLASPTSPSLGKTSDILKRAISYEEAGVDGISFITEKHYFKGSTTFIPKIKSRVSIPLLQKDFVIDPYQIYEAKMLGADAILLIARLVTQETLRKFVATAHDIGVEPVVEISDEEDLEKAINTATACIAVNARDLETFTINVSHACTLLKKIPDSFIKLGFSGIHSQVQVVQYQNAGAMGVLVGTSLMKSNDSTVFLSSLREGEA